MHFGERNLSVTLYSTRTHKYITNMIAREEKMTVWYYCICCFRICSERTLDTDYMLKYTTYYAAHSAVLKVDIILE